MIRYSRKASLARVQPSSIELLSNCPKTSAARREFMTRVAQIRNLFRCYAPSLCAWHTHSPPAYRGIGTINTWVFTGKAPLYGTSIDRTTVFALEGNYTLAFGVTDKDGDSSSDTVQIAVLNRPPVCTAATPSLSTIWPVNHKFVPVTVLGVTDPESDPVVTTITSIFQAEPVDTTGDGKFTPDGKGVGAATAEVRAERTVTPKVPGKGRVYHIGFAADDGHGGICTGEVRIGVPHDQSKPVVDDGALHDSTGTASGGQGAPSERLSVFLLLVHR